MSGQTVERRQEPRLCLRRHECLGDVALTYPYFGSVRPEGHELRDHLHARMRFGPRQKLRRAHFVVDGVRRIFAAVAVVDHDGREDPAGPSIDTDVLAWRTGASRTPEMCELIRVDHAPEDELARSVEDPGKTEFVLGRYHDPEPLRRLLPDRRPRRCASNLSKRWFQI